MNHETVTSASLISPFKHEIGCFNSEVFGIETYRTQATGMTAGGYFEWKGKFVLKSRMATYTVFSEYHGFDI